MRELEQKVRELEAALAYTERKWREERRKRLPWWRVILERTKQQTN